MERGRKKWRGVGEEVDKVVNFKLQKDKKLLLTLCRQKSGLTHALENGGWDCQ